MVTFTGLRTLVLIGLLSTDTNTQDILKLNDGIYFQKVKSEVVSHSSWQHVFAFELPSNLLEMGVSQALTASPGGSMINETYTECIHSIGRKLYPGDYKENDRRGQKYNESNDQIHLCDSMRTRLEQGIQAVRKIHERIYVLQSGIHALLPKRLDRIDPVTRLTSMGSRRKRAVLATMIAVVAAMGVGAVMGNGIASWASDRDISVLQQQIVNMQTLQRKQWSRFSETAEQFASFSKATSDRLDELEDLVHRNALNTHRVLVDIDNRLRVLETENALQNKIENLKDTLWLVYRHLQDFRDALQLLKNGFLPTQLISFQRMLDVITGVSRAAAKRGLDLVSLKPETYFTEARLISMVYRGRLLIMLNMPVSQFGRKQFHTYKVRLVDLPIPGETGAVMRLETKVKGLTVGSYRDEVYYVEHDDESVYRENGILGKGRDPRSNYDELHVIRKDWTESCLMAILQDSPPDIKRMCKYTVYANGLKPTALWLGENKVLLTAASNITIYSRQGYDQLRWVNNTGGCKQCLITLPQDGILVTEEFMVLGDTYNQTMEVQFTANRPMAQMWFSEDDLKTLRGDNLFDDEPIMRTPNMHLDELTASLSNLSNLERKEVRFDMHNLVERIRNQSEQVKEELDEVDSTLNYNLWWGDWLKSNTNYINIVMGAWLVILSITSMVVCMKLRALNVAILLAEKIKTIKAARHNTINLIYMSSTKATRTVGTVRHTDRGERKNTTSIASPLMANIESLVADIKRDLQVTWIGMITTVIGLSLVALICVVIAKRRRRGMPILVTYVGLSFSYGNETRTIILMECDSILEDIEIKADRPPEKLSLRGKKSLRPILTFDWNATALIKSLGIRLEIPNRVRISRSEMLFIARGMKQDHRTTPVLVSGSTIKVIRKKTTLNRKKSSEYRTPELV